MILNTIRFFRETDGDCKCTLGYSGADELLLNIATSPVGRIGKPVHLVTYDLLLDYTYCWSKSGMSQRAFNNKHNQKLQMTYGATQNELLPWHVFRSAVTTFWSDVLNLNLKNSFRCRNCGDKPNNLVIDGVSIGIKISSLKDKSELFLPFSGNSLLDAPTYKERMFIKLKKDRDLLKNAANAEKYPIITNKTSNDAHMTAIKEFITSMKKSGYSCPPKALCDFLCDLASASSTVTMFQPFNKNLLEQLLESFRDEKVNILRDTNLRELQSELRLFYPVFMDRLQGLASPLRSNDFHLPDAVRKIYITLIQFVLQFDAKLPYRTAKDYTKRVQGEIEGQIIPLFPPMYERARYTADDRYSNKDRDYEQELCSKLFPEGQIWTPGLFIITCACSDKRIYGIVKMVHGESPRIMFDIIILAHIIEVFLGVTV